MFWAEAPASANGQGPGESGAFRSPVVAAGCICAHVCACVRACLGGEGTRDLVMGRQPWDEESLQVQQSISVSKYPRKSLQALKQGNDMMGFTFKKRFLLFWKELGKVGVEGDPREVEVRVLGWVRKSGIRETSKRLLPVQPPSCFISFVVLSQTQ